MTVRRFARLCSAWPRHTHQRLSRGERGATMLPLHMLEDGLWTTLSRSDHHPEMPEDKLNAFWERVPFTEDGAIEWPEGAEARETLAREILAAKFVGALEHVVEEALSVVAGTPPSPGSYEFRMRSQRAEVMSTLSAAQRDAVRQVIIDLARSSVYWPMVKVSKIPTIQLDVVVSPRDSAGESVGDFPLQPDGELSWELVASLARFSRTWPRG